MTLPFSPLLLQVGLAKVNSAGSASKSLVFQDLTIGLGDAVQSGDSVEVKYTGWLYSSRSFGDVSMVKQRTLTA